MGRTLSATLILMITAVAFAFTTDLLHAQSTARTTPAAAAERCDWMDNFRAALRQLGEDPGHWSVESIDSGAAGHVRPGSRAAVISPNVVCEYVADVVYHEWAHLQQFRMHPTEAAARAFYGTQTTSSGSPRAPRASSARGQRPPCTSAQTRPATSAGAPRRTRSAPAT